MLKSSQTKLRFKRVFSDPKKPPYRQVDWSEYGVERGKALRGLIDRVVAKYSETAKSAGYFATLKDRTVFERELIWLMLNQALAFEDKVWFTVGRDGAQTVSGCGIISVEDSAEAQINCWGDLICGLSRGVQLGVNLSKLSGGQENSAAVDPVGFVKTAESLAGSHNLRRMFILDVDHPSIVDFVNASYELISPNTMLSVRVSDGFMKAVEADGEFGLRSRQSGEVVETLSAGDLLWRIAAATRHHSQLCLQFDSAINAWQTTTSQGKITASSPAGDFMASDGLECPRASLDLLKFVSKNRFEFEKFIAAVELAITALDVSLDFGDFSTTGMRYQTRRWRPVGLGFTNLEASFEQLKLKPGSQSAKVLASAIANLLSAVAYRRSAELAGAVGVSDGLKKDLPAQLRAVKRHYQASMHLTDAVVDQLKLQVNINELIFAANLEWEIALEFGRKHGFRNCQLSLLAPDDKSFILNRVEASTVTDPAEQLELLASLQPFLSGGIDAPINLPTATTAEEVAQLYKTAWRRGLKSLTICRQVEYN
jgi:ribonucleoside-diphosphate reductase alpha chain